MTFRSHLRTLAAGLALLASSVVTAGPAWSAPAGPVPSKSPYTDTGTAADPAPDWVWPLRPRPPVVHEFDPPDKPWGSGHRGVDLLGSERQRVRSAADGVVSYAGTLAGRGVIAVTHGELRTTYEPVEAVVEVGDRVQAGDVIGRLQAVASHCAPRHCLHWGALRGSTYLDPLGLVGASGTVRLLPLGGMSSTSVTAPATAPVAGPDVAVSRSDRLVGLTFAAVYAALGGP